MGRWLLQVNYFNRFLNCEFKFIFCAQIRSFASSKVSKRTSWNADDKGENSIAECETIGKRDLWDGQRSRLKTHISPHAIWSVHCPRHDISIWCDRNCKSTLLPGKRNLSVLWFKPGIVCPSSNFSWRSCVSLHNKLHGFYEKFYRSWCHLWTRTSSPIKKRMQEN